MKNDLRIVFIGTPDFAVESLNALMEADKNVVAVITAPDRKAGRGQKINESAVKKVCHSKRKFRFYNLRTLKTKILLHR